MIKLTKKLQLQSVEEYAAALGFTHCTYVREGLEDRVCFQLFGTGNEISLQRMINWHNGHFKRVSMFQSLNDQARVLIQDCGIALPNGDINTQLLRTIIDKLQAASKAKLVVIAKLQVTRKNEIIVQNHMVKLTDLGKMCGV